MNKVLDPYRLLSIPRNATMEEIKSAYRKLAMQLHPDRNNGDNSKTEKFKSVTEAYDLLTNNYERKNYDQQNNPYQPSPYGKDLHNRSRSIREVDPSHFNVKKWNAYHYGEEIFIDLGTSSSSPKKKGKSRKDRDLFKEFEDDDIEDLLRQFKVKSSNGNNSSSDRRKNKSKNKDECQIS